MEHGRTPYIHALSERIAVLAERIMTLNTDLSASLERSGAAFERPWADMAVHHEDAVKRDRDNLRRRIGLRIAAVAILGLLIHL